MILLVAGAALTGCKKYEEGPMISFKSKKARLQRVWTEESFIDANGNETTPSSPNKYELKDDGQVSVNGGTSSSALTWQLSDDKSKLELITTLGSTSTTDASEILRLTSKELWLKDDNGSQTHLKAE
ncbi:MAG: hypothetical protein KDD54_01390 [Flavobacteriales bacterium]|nr:hypothetical protein [Flavobacteriales bacterium]